ncbi:hypothetical protein [Cohnella terricola]|uniref:Uncharacterized protein n=1 Tax=Cohnella terricola TaxID=1289167 RepID=A0A559JIJ1_9BACL|nr:hypothetical protein [Cohnella terricola]TVX99687.1 hypothetical protein FPZ45_12065 [Cohnella terricola]
MLDFEQKLAIMETFPQLERRDVSLGRVNFHYAGSVTDKKNVGFHFHPNGNGYVYAAEIGGVETDDKGFVNVRDYGADELRDLVERSIRSLSDDGTSLGEGQEAGGLEEKWRNPEGEELSLQFEDDMWYLFAGLNLEMAFETREEAVEYLQEEGFSRV